MSSTDSYIHPVTLSFRWTDFYSLNENLFIFHSTKICFTLTQAQYKQIKTMFTIMKILATNRDCTSLKSPSIYPNGFDVF